MTRHLPLAPLRRLIMLCAVLSLVLHAIPAMARPGPAVPPAVSQACANAAMNATWNADINLAYSRTAEKPGLRIAHEQSGNAGVTFEMNGLGSGSEDRVWLASAVSGSGSINTVETQIIPGQPERKTITEGDGPIQLSTGVLRLNMVTCTYSLTLNLWVNATTTYHDLPNTEGPASVLHVEVYNIPVDASASGGPIPTLSGAASPPARLSIPEPETDMFWLPASASAVATILSEQGHATAGAAALDWSLRPNTAPSIAEVEFQHQDMPSERWVPVSGQRGTVDGNTVLIIARIRNPGALVTLPVRFYDDETNELLPDCDETVTLLPEADTLIETSCVWDTEGWAWDGGVGGIPPRQHSDHRIRIELGAPANLLDTVERPFLVRPKPVILVHGLNSNDRGWSAYPGFLRQANDYWEAYAVPGMMTGDSIALPQASTVIAHNAQIMHQYIERVRETENAWHVDIVAHSMGGLISRLYIDRFMPRETPTQRPVAKHLVMLGTPNRGSECATVQLAIGVAHRLPNLLAPADLTPTAVAVFNQTYTNQRGVEFSVLAGNSWGTFVCNPQLIPNDLVVTVPSAHHTYTDIGLTSRNHIQMTGSLLDFGQWVFPRLAVSRDAGARLPQARASGAEATAAAEAEVPLQLAQMASATVPAGAEVALPLALPEAETVSVMFIAAPGVAVSLRDPSGAMVDTSPAGDTQTLRGFLISAPIRGVWSLQAVSAEAAATPIYATVAVSGGDLQLSGHAASDASGAAALTAQMTRSGAPVAGAQMVAVLVRSDGSTEEIPLADDGGHNDGAAGDGVYGAQASSGAAITAVTLRAAAGDEERTVLAALSRPAQTFYQVFLPLTRR